jgi:hypothetical protein
MMGIQAAPERLFYDFCLENHVSNVHFLRQIDRFLDLSDLRPILRPFYNPVRRHSTLGYKNPIQIEKAGRE